MKTDLIVALDVSNAAEARPLIKELAPIVPVIKVGSILFTREGRSIIDMIRDAGSRVFLDLKFYDIPNTVREVAEVTAGLGVDMFTLHLSGGSEMIRGALAGLKAGTPEGGKSPLALGVTVLTSMNDAILHDDLKVSLPLTSMVEHLARMGYENGMRGFVCSPFEIELIRKTAGSEVTIVTPGVRMAGEAKGDQKRVMTPADAAKAGANYIVMGRSVLAASDKKGIVAKINEELASVNR